MVIFRESHLFFFLYYCFPLTSCLPGASASLQTLHTSCSLPPKSTARVLSCWYYPKLLCQPYPTACVCARTCVCMCVCVWQCEWERLCVWSRKVAHNSPHVRWFLLAVQGHTGNEPNNKKKHITAATGNKHTIKLESDLSSPPLPTRFSVLCTLNWRT